MRQYRIWVKFLNGRTEQAVVNNATLVYLLSTANLVLRDEADSQERAVSILWEEIL